MKKESFVNIINTKIHNLSFQETVEYIQQTIIQHKQIHHTVVNAGKIAKMHNDAELSKSVNSADLINADGQAVVWASRFLNKPIKERVAGVDLMEACVEMAAQHKYTIYLFGATQEVVETLVEKYKSQFGNTIIAGYRNGYFNDADENQIVQDIKSAKPQMLFVAMPSPKKEIFLYKHRYALQDVNFIMGVGGSFDVFAGKTKRAPKWMQNSGLEWFYRFLQEPKRMWKRYLIGNTKFIYLVLKEKLKPTHK
jgi:N-acetylglucosaminyldiphosphoundecaprenol N-acetyl-beta-D-mannosaminyltransferase